MLLAGLLRGGEEALINRSQRASEADLIQVRPDDPPAKQQGRTLRELSRGDEETLRESPLLGGAAIASEATLESRAFYQSRKKRVRLVGASPGALSLYHLEVEKGRFLTDDDLASRRRVCVIGEEVWKELLEQKTDPVGLELRIEDQMWMVVGVLKNKPLLGGGGDGTWMWNRKVLIPHTTFDALFSPSHSVNRLFVRLGGAGDLAARLAGIEGMVKSTLLRRHYSVSNFKVEGEDSDANQERLIFTIIKMLLLGTGLLSLFVGGINIMNIMLVTVTERTREIGVRRALGATPGEIMLQFLLEAAFIALGGGLIGVLGGVALSALIAFSLTRLLGAFALHVETWSILLGLALSLSTGICFGLFPAWRAARLDPVEALRYE